MGFQPTRQYKYFNKYLTSKLRTYKKKKVTFFEMSARQTISRVLSFKLIIYLGLKSLLSSSNQP